MDDMTELLNRLKEEHKDLMFAPTGWLTNDDYQKYIDREGIENLRNWERKRTELCRQCGWDSYYENHTSYISRVKMHHSRDDFGLWKLGDHYMLRDEGNHANISNDYVTQMFLRKQPNLYIPLVQEMKSLSKRGDKHYLTLMSRAKGETLDTVWHTQLNDEQKSSIRNQLCDAIKQIRQFTSPICQKVGGGRIDDHIIGTCLHFDCKRIGHTPEEWFETLAEGLRRGLAVLHKTNDISIIEQKFQELKDNFPKSEPYVLTHGDLDFSNIIVKDGKTEAIIDWGVSGYYPWWAERLLSMKIPDGRVDELSDPLWESFYPGMDREAFVEKIVRPVSDVKEAWEKGDATHPNMRTAWFRPVFCKCKPFMARLNAADLGYRPEHKVPALSDPIPENYGEENYREE